MSGTWRALGGRRRTLARLVYARDRTDPDYVCPRCRRPIDWTLPYRDPHTELVNLLAKSIDHADELQDGGALTDLDNLVSAHLSCNSVKGAARRWERQREARAATTTTVIVDASTI